jgi:immune inhibitor A
LKKKKLLSTAMALSLGLGLWNAAIQDTSSTKAKSFSEGTSIHTFRHGGPVDLAVANEEKLIEMLMKSGKIPANATPEESEQMLRQYLKAKVESVPKENGQLYKHEIKREKALEKKHNETGLVNGSGKKLGKGKESDIPSIEQETWNGVKRVDRVLVLLIEYPDFPHNSIQPSETDMYYQDYSKEHYHEMIFGDAEGYYEGPNGEKLISVKKYYEEQSGGSYSIAGEVAGWYMAKYPASYYGGNVPAPDGNDANPRALVKEALEAVAKDLSVDLSKYDLEDRYDLDGDGNYREPDGLIDHLMIVHSSVGEEAGGGQLGGDAIWSHRWNLERVFKLPDTTSSVPYWGGQLGAYDYTIEPADGAAGVFAHEYGHDLGLPDEYDTLYSGKGEPVSYWSIMSSGSWAGKIPGTEPTGFSAWAKEFLQATMPGSNWMTGVTIDLNEIPHEGIEVILDQASTKGTNHDAIRINLPDKENVLNTPFSGIYSYYSGKGDNLDHSMFTALDLTHANEARLTFKAWYQIEKDWDYASIQVKESGSNQWISIPGNITTVDDPHGQNPGNGITGYSDGWIDAVFDLSAFAGKRIELRFNYWTDVAVAEAGFFVDDIQITADGQSILFDDAETNSQFTLGDFIKSNGTFYTKQYYLLEWRNHQGVDQGLAHILRGGQLLSFDPGLVVWYVDESYDNNWTGIHPGEGFLGVVDADQHTLKWSGNEAASTRYQVHDASFSLQKGQKFSLRLGNMLLNDNDTAPISIFDDSKSYENKGLLDAGRNVPSYGLKIRVIDENSDRTSAKILLYR